jgi:hypothetical protein
MPMQRSHHTYPRKHGWSVMFSDKKQSLSAQSGPKAACQHTLLYDAAGRL